MPTSSEHAGTKVDHFIAGGVAGVCSVISGHPLDTIKVWGDNLNDFSFQEIRWSCQELLDSCLVSTTPK